MKKLILYISFLLVIQLSFAQSNANRSLNLINNDCPILKNLVDEINGNPQLKNAIKDNPSLVDALKKIDDLGDDAFKQLRKDPDFLKNFNNILSNVDLNDHIFKGDIKFELGRIRGIRGVHSKIAVNVPNNQINGFRQGDIRFKTGTKNPSNASPNDFYSVKIEIYGKKGDGSGGWIDGWINKRSSFFPDSWSKQKIQAELANAFKTKSFNRVESGANVFRGRTTDNSIIEIVIRDGVIKTAYPIIL